MNRYKFIQGEKTKAKKKKKKKPKHKERLKSKKKKKVKNNTDNFDVDEYIKRMERMQRVFTEAHVARMELFSRSERAIANARRKLTHE